MIKINLLNSKTQVKVGVLDSLLKKIPINAILDAFAKQGGSYKVFLRELAVPSVFILGIYYCLDFYNQKILEEEQSNLMQLTNEKNQLDQTIRKLKALDPIKKSLDSEEYNLAIKLKELKLLHKKKYLAIRMLATISASVPNKTWIQELTLLQDKLNITGHSYDFGEISDFMKALSKNSLFNNVQLAFTSKEEITNSQFKSESSDANLDLAKFEIVGTMRVD